MSDSVECEIAEGVAIIELRRPALNVEMKLALLDAVRAVARDSRVRALLLAGSGSSFCVGQDLKEHAEALRDAKADALSTVREHYNPIVTTLSELDIPVVAAIHGACVGAGLGFVLTADLRIAGASARFGTAFASIGLSADSGLSASLVHAVGRARATELLLLAESFTAADALAWGVVHRVVPDDDLRDEAAALAQRLSRGPTLAYGQIKRLLRNPRLADVLAAEAQSQELLAQTEDHQGAVAAFLAKQKPMFRGA